MSIGADNTDWVRLAGRSGADGWDVAIGPEANWRHTGLLVASLEAGAERTLDLADREAVVVPLSGGGVQVSAAAPDGTDDSVRLAGRESVWAGTTDVAYVPARSRLTLRAEAQVCRVAVCLAAGAESTAAAARSLTRLPAAEVPVERRGAGIASRLVRNFGVPGVLDADRIIACEVITPAGNWSSWPPHKHDQERPGVETELEEIYYFQTRSVAPQVSDPVGYQRVYGSDERPIDVLAEVRTDDVVLVPHGWHGPAMAAPDADLYYLNVMAGPGPERAWLICDDPAHAWVRQAWPDLPVDPRLA